MSTNRFNKFKSIFGQSKQQVANKQKQLANKQQIKFSEMELNEIKTFLGNHNGPMYKKIKLDLNPLITQLESDKSSKTYYNTLHTNFFGWKSKILTVKNDLKKKKNNFQGINMSPYNIFFQKLVLLRDKDMQAYFSLIASLSSLTKSQIQQLLSLGTNQNINISNIEKLKRSLASNLSRTLSVKQTKISEKKNTALTSANLNEQTNQVIKQIKVKDGEKEINLDGGKKTTKIQIIKKEIEKMFDIFTIINNNSNEIFTKTNEILTLKNSLKQPSTLSPSQKLSVEQRIATLEQEITSKILNLQENIINIEFQFFKLMRETVIFEPLQYQINNFDLFDEIEDLLNLYLKNSLQKLEDDNVKNYLSTQFKDSTHNYTVIGTDNLEEKGFIESLYEQTSSQINKKFYVYDMVIYYIFAKANVEQIINDIVPNVYDNRKLNSNMKSVLNGTQNIGYVEKEMLFESECYYRTRGKEVATPENLYEYTINKLKNNDFTKTLNTFIDLYYGFNNTSEISQEDKENIIHNQYSELYEMVTGNDLQSYEEEQIENRKKEFQDIEKMKIETLKKLGYATNNFTKLNNFFNTKSYKNYKNTFKLLGGKKQRGGINKLPLNNDLVEKIIYGFELSELSQNLKEKLKKLFISINFVEPVIEELVQKIQKIATLTDFDEELKYKLNEDKESIIEKLLKKITDIDYNFFQFMEDALSSDDPNKIPLSKQIKYFSKFDDIQKLVNSILQKSCDKLKQVKDDKDVKMKLKRFFKSSFVDKQSSKVQYETNYDEINIEIHSYDLLLYYIFALGNVSDIINSMIKFTFETGDGKEWNNTVQQFISQKGRIRLNQINPVIIYREAYEFLTINEFYPKLRNFIILQHNDKYFIHNHTPITNANKKLYTLVITDSNTNVLSLNNLNVNTYSTQKQEILNKKQSENKKRQEQINEVAEPILTKIEEQHKVFEKSQSKILSQREKLVELRQILRILKSKAEAMPNGEKKNEVMSNIDTIKTGLGKKNKNSNLTDDSAYETLIRQLSEIEKNILENLTEEQKNAFAILNKYKGLFDSINDNAINKFSNVIKTGDTSQITIATNTFKKAVFELPIMKRLKKALSRASQRINNSLDDLNRNNNNTYASNEYSRNRIYAVISEVKSYVKEQILSIKNLNEQIKKISDVLIASRGFSNSGFLPHTTKRRDGSQGKINQNLINMNTSTLPDFNEEILTGGKKSTKSKSTKSKKSKSKKSKTTESKTTKSKTTKSKTTKYKTTKSKSTKSKTTKSKTTKSKTTKSKSSK